MLFNSFEYIVFFLLTVIIYYMISIKFRWILLLISSYVFYMAFEPYLLILMLFTTYINFVNAKKIYIYKNLKKKKLILRFTIFINFLLLFVFKYLTFSTTSLNYIFSKIDAPFMLKTFDIILPIGISFYTFQVSSYLVDVYKKTYKPMSNFFKFSLFICFFPQLIAGPIERANDLISELFKKNKFDVNNFFLGLKYLSWGFFKKIVVADRIAICVNTVYNSPKYYNGVTFFIVTLLFSFQIYCDFSGYSDIGKGSAKIFGINLTENFKSPYQSKSIKEFWTRWHISLSSWFKDYLYIPLGGNRSSKIITYRNIIIVFLISGLWHGANWTFVIWGLLHGIFQIIEAIFSKNKKNVIYKNNFCKNIFINNFKKLFTFLLVSISWVFFRSNSIEDSFFIFEKIIDSFYNFSTSFDYVYLYNSIKNIGLSYIEFIIIIVFIIFINTIENFSKNENIHIYLMQKPFFTRFLFYYIIIILIFSLGVYYNAGTFIYFQF